jgi:hypothetical protein
VLLGLLLAHESQFGQPVLTWLSLFLWGNSPLWDNSPDYEIKQSNLRYSAIAVSVSSIVCELRNAIAQLVDDIDSLHVGVSHSSLLTDYLWIFHLCVVLFSSYFCYSLFDFWFLIFWFLIFWSLKFSCLCFVRKAVNCFSHLTQCELVSRVEIISLWIALSRNKGFLWCGILTLLSHTLTLLSHTCGNTPKLFVWEWRR